MVLVQKRVEDIVEGEHVDLTSCPFLKDEPSAQFEYAEVAHAERETDACVVLSYEGLDRVGYPVGTVLRVSVPDLPAIRILASKRAPRSKYDFMRSW